MYSQLDIAKAKMAAGKRLNSTDKAALIGEAKARGEKVPVFKQIDVGVTLVMRMMWAVLLLVVCSIVFYSCAVSAFH